MRIRVPGANRCHLVRIDVIQGEVLAQSQTRNHRDQLLLQQQVEEAAVDPHRPAYVPQIFISPRSRRRNAGYGSRISAAKSYGWGSKARQFYDQVLVDFSGQHHRGHPQGGGVGDSQTVHETRGDAELFQSAAQAFASSMYQNDLMSFSPNPRDLAQDVLADLRILQNAPAQLNREPQRVLSPAVPGFHPARASS